MNTLDNFKRSFNSVGWFIPPYISLGFLDLLSKRILDKGSAFDQIELEDLLSAIYSPEHLAGLVAIRYAETPYVMEYKAIISEATEAHFLGLNHIAVSGLMPVIEGAGKKILASRNLPSTKMKNIFTSLAEDCKTEAAKKKIGNVGQILSMMDSFIYFAENYLYVNSNQYSLPDKTNRHGILHGAFSDADYGQRINYYKSIAAVNFLCFIAAFRASISWLAPSPTMQSQQLCNHYIACIAQSRLRPNILMYSNK